MNYLYGLPHFAVSIAAEVDGEVVAGVVLAPALGLEYAASLGGGATCNRQPVRPRPAVPLGQRLVGTGFSYEQEARAREATYVARLLPRIRDIRRLGSCALDICAVASGLLDAYVEEGAHIWDHAAAGLICTEAGGVLEVTRSPGDKRLLICAPADGFAEFREVVADTGFVRGEGPHAAGDTADPEGLNTSRTGNSPTSPSVHETRRGPKMRSSRPSGTIGAPTRALRVTGAGWGEKKTHGHRLRRTSQERGRPVRRETSKIKARRHDKNSGKVDEDEAEAAESFELPGADLSHEELAVGVMPRQEDEFTCISSSWSTTGGQLADEKRLICRDCAA